MVALPVPRKDINVLRGIEGVVPEGREYPGVLVQLAAAGSGIHPVVGLVLRNCTAICPEKGDRVQVGADLSRTMAMWIG